MAQGDTIQNDGCYFDSVEEMMEATSSTTQDASIYLSSENVPLHDMVEVNIEPTEGSVKIDCLDDCYVYFKDGIQRVDFILASLSTEVSTEKTIVTRQIFEENLKYEGLKLEYAFQETTNLRFVKIHAPWEVLSRYAEILQFKMPMKEMTFVQCPEPSSMHANEDSKTGLDITKYYQNSILIRQISHMTRSFTDVFHSDSLVFPNRDKRLTALFSRNKQYMFDIPEQKVDFFSPAERSHIIDFILKRKRFTQNVSDVFGFGLKKLLADGVYFAAYPLHEGRMNDPCETNMRLFLLNHWASVKCIMKRQPLDQLRQYLGTKIGLYFSWLGFYTYMLIPASILGIICFIYGCVTMNSDVISTEVCESHSDIIMCPNCDNNCGYWRLGQSCFLTTLTHLFDNTATIMFAVFMTLWGTIFLELWKRYSAIITHRWDLTGLDTSEEHPRPEYLANLANAKRKINFITRMYEPYVSFWTRKVPYSILSVSVVLFMMLLALAAVVGVILYRLSVRTALATVSFESQTKFSSLISTFIVASSAALLNLICIMIFNRIYSYVATYMTELEMHRTQTEFDDSLTLKMFLLQFVNYYSSIFYIAFFKGKHIGYPGKYDLFLGYRQEECGIEGCLMELSIQLGIIMVGKQALNSLIEMSLPKLKAMYTWWSVLRNQKIEEEIHATTPWEEDFKLSHWEPSDLFYEYLEMVLQFGFVTMFVAAFPLAPFFAFLNNALEIRLDGKKLITSYRRPVGQRVHDIGIWYGILDSIGRLAVVANAVIIAFTSHFIPRILYQIYVSPDNNLHGFVNFSLSYFDVSHFDSEFQPKELLDPKTKQPIPINYCRYEDFRQPPWGERKYDFTDLYWHILCARLAFVIVFVTFVSLLSSLTRTIIPDMPKSLKEQIRHETFITNEMMIETELQHCMHNDSASTHPPGWVNGNS